MKNCTWICFYSHSHNRNHIFTKSFIWMPFNLFRFKDYWKCVKHKVIFDWGHQWIHQPIQFEARQVNERSKCSLFVVRWPMRWLIFFQRFIFLLINFTKATHQRRIICETREFTYAKVDVKKNKVQNAFE